MKESIKRIVVDKGYPKLEIETNGDVNVVSSKEGLLIVNGVLVETGGTISNVIEFENQEEMDRFDEIPF